MRQRKGFTLVELIVVIMILGILAAIAVPKLLDTSKTATDNGLKQSLSVVRDAIERYAADNAGVLPGQGDDLPGDLANYLRGDFPECPVDSPTTPEAVKYSANAPIAGVADPVEGWHYAKDTGDFICNSSDASASDPGTTYDKF